MYGLGCGVWGLGFGVEVAGFRVQGLGLVPRDQLDDELDGDRLCVKRIWHMLDSQGQVLALAFRSKPVKSFTLYPLRSAAYHVTSSTSLLLSSLELIDTNVYEPYVRALLGSARERHQVSSFVSYRGTSLLRNRTPLGPYRRPMSRVEGGS